MRKKITVFTLVSSMLLSLTSPAFETIAAESDFSCNHIHTVECEEGCTHECDDSCRQSVNEENIASDSNAFIDNNEVLETDIVSSDKDGEDVFDEEEIVSSETVSGNDCEEVFKDTQTTIDDTKSQDTQIEVFSNELTYLETLVLVLGEDNVEINYDDNSITLVNDIIVNEPINITENTILNLNNFSLRGKMTSVNDNLFNINSSLTIKGDGNVIVEDGDNAISIASTGTFILDGGNISSTNSNRAVFNAGTFTMNSGSISNNHTSANGSAVLVNNGALFNMNGGEIFNNSTSAINSNNGGTIVLQRNSICNISGNAIIRNNTVSADGGAILVKLDSTLNVFGNSIIENNEAIRGGGIAASSSKVNIYGNAKIKDNTASEDGNDIYLIDSSTCSLMENCSVGDIFKSNNSVLNDNTKKATDLQKLIDETEVGGILVLDKDYNKEVPLYIDKNITIDFNGYSITSSITNNIEELISVRNKSTLTLQGNGNIIQTASMKCGLIGVEEGSILNIYDMILESDGNRCLFSENATINFYSGTIQNSGALSGYVGGGIVLINSTLNMYDGNIINCTSKEGGAIRAVVNSTVNIEGGSLLNNNSHTDDGGAIYCNNSLLTIKNCEIKENVAKKAGGAIACYNTTSNILDGCVIDNNTSGHNGGGIFSDGILNINNATITNNESIYYGGGIHGNDIKISGNTLIKNNTASFGGGVLCGYMYENQNAEGVLTLTDNVVIEENKAVKSETADWLIGVGGGIWAHTLNMSGNVNVRNNHSDRNAGGIYARDKVIITSGVIESNIAEGVGGGIFVFNRGFIQGTPEQQVKIINNEAHDISHHLFAGGGIFVEHPVSGQWQGPDGASLQVNSAIITNNTAAYGGGVGGCGDAVIREFDNIGASIYENTATKDEHSQDLYCDGIATITTKALGGSIIEWTGIGVLDGKTVDINLKEGSASYGDIRVTANASAEDIATANSIAGVLISGNKSASGGGGIGGNGAITLGNQITSMNVKKIWDDFDDLRGERPESISVSLMKTGMEMQNDGTCIEVNDVIDTVELSDANNWSYYWTGLSQYDDKNSAYVYRVIENDIPENYICKIEQNGTNVIVTNIHTKINFTVKKIWDDENNKDNIRPDSIQIEILRNGEHFDTIELKEDVEWEHLFDGLDRFDKDGICYDFSLSEIEVPKGYVSTTHAIKDGVIIVVNKHTSTEIPKTNLNIEKIWDDEDDKDNLRPESVNVEILRNNKHFEFITLSKDNDWKYSLSNIDKVDEDNIEYEYSVKEINIPDGYASSVLRNKNDFIITNKHIPKEKLDIMIKKVWDDEDNKDNIRPNSIKVSLLRNNIKIDEITLSESNNWEYLYENLDKTDDLGNIFTYSVEENESNIYDVSIKKTTTSEYVLFTIINKYRSIPEPEKTSIFIKKIWQDNDDFDKLRPSSIDVDIYQNNTKIDTIILSSSNNWEYLYSDLLKADDNGNEYVYSIKEATKVNGYTTTINDYVITNIHIPQEPEKTSISIVKVWNDYNDFDKIRPQKIEVVIYANNIEYKTISLTKDNNWQFNITNLDKYDKNNELIKYSVKEVKVENYDSTIKQDGNSFTIINTHIPKTNITIHKVWDDDDNKFNKRPENIDVDVYRNNIKYQSIQLSADDNWYKELTNLDLFDENGTLYSYSIEEKNIPDNYQSFIDNNSYTITNKYIEENKPKTNIIIRKVWDDFNDKDNLRPESIEVDVYRNNILFKTILLTKESGWNYELVDLDVNDDDENKYIYTIKEKEVPKGYTSSVDNFSIINKHIPKDDIQKTSITISKIWDDDNNKDNARPDSIDVEIYRNGILYNNVKIKGTNNWILTLNDLDKYDRDGNEYIYSIKEINIPDNYVSIIDGFTIINKLKETPLKTPKSEKPQENTGIPQTGDNSNTDIYLLLMLLLGMLLVSAGLRKNE